MNKIKDINSALEVFKEAATKQAEATEQGDYKLGNKYYDKIVKAFFFLKKQNATTNLLGFLSNPSIGVRLWAALYLLPTHEKDSIRVLQDITKTAGIHSLTAETTLNEWLNGNLKI